MALLRHYSYLDRHNPVGSILLLVVILGIMLTTSSGTRTSATVTANSGLATCPTSPIYFCLDLVGYSDIQSDEICVCDVESGHYGEFECSRPGSGGEDDSLQVWCRGKVIGTCEFEIKEEEYIDAEKVLDWSDSVIDDVIETEQSLSSTSTLGPKPDPRDGRGALVVLGGLVLVAGLAAMATVYQRKAHQIRHRRTYYTTAGASEEDFQTHDGPQSSTRSSNGSTATTAKSGVELAILEFA